MAYGIPDEYSSQIEAALLRDMPAGSYQSQIPLAFNDAYHRHGGFNTNSDYNRVYNLVRHQLNDSYNWQLPEDWDTFGGTPGLSSPNARAVPGFGTADMNARWQATQEDDGDGLGGLLGVGAGLLGAYFGMPYLGAAFNTLTTGEVNPLSWLGAAAGSGGAFDGALEGFNGLEAGGDIALGNYGGGMDWWGTDYLGDFGFPSEGGNLMPPAIPETPAQLQEWGLREVSPGMWEQPSMPGSSMSASDWFKTAKQALGLAGGGDSGGLGGLAQLFGAVAPGIGGYLASNAQADAYRDISNRQLNEGQWARDKLKASYMNPNEYLQGEGKVFLDDAAKRQGYALSTGGNPAASGNALTQMMSDAYARNSGALGSYRGGLSAAGYGTSYNAGNQSELAGVAQQGNAYNALGSIGSGVNNIFNPPKSTAQTLADLLKGMQ